MYSSDSRLYSLTAISNMNQLSPLEQVALQIYCADPKLSIESAYEQAVEFLKYSQESVPLQKSKETVERILTRLSGGKYYSPEKLSELLSEMTNGKVTLPQSEIQRLRSLIPKQLTDEQIQSIEKLKNATEDKATPIIMQIPKELMSA